ncbi:hypothetical protein GF323_01460 [Candidatus Woesearchaeota archaeon]|nr:hypothetical protein [Candidatus Woesearchaeota archaeon]
MHYFKASIDYIKNNRKKSILIAALDLFFYLLFFPIFSIWIYFFSRAISRMPMQTMGAALESMQKEALLSLQSMLIKVFIGIIISVLLLFLLVLLNTAVFKIIIWLFTLNKMPNYKIIMKSLLLLLVLSVIFLIPLAFTAVPFAKSANEYMYAQTLSPYYADFIPMLIVFFFYAYFLALAFYFLAKEESFKKAFKNCFKLGILKLHKLILPFLALFIIPAAVMKLLGNLGILTNIVGLIIILLTIITISFSNRIYIAKFLQ